MKGCVWIYRVRLTWWESRDWQGVALIYALMISWTVVYG